MDKTEIMELRVDDMVSGGDELYRVIGKGRSTEKPLRLERVRDGKRILPDEKELMGYTIFIMFRDMGGPRRKFERVME